MKFHKINAKYCLKIQGLTNEKFTCKFCLYQFSTKNKLSSHSFICKSKTTFVEKEEEINKLKKEKEEEINKLKKELKIHFQKEINELKIKTIQLNDEINNQKLIIAKLETENKIYNKDHDVIIDLAKQPKNTTTTNNKILITAPIDLSVERIANIIETKYTNILGGQKALADFTADEILKDINGKIQYLCTDISRQSFKYMNDKNEICNDPQSTILISKLCEAGIKHKANEIANIMWTKEDGSVDSDQFVKISTPLLEIMSVDYDDDNSIFRKELSKTTNVK